MKGQLCISGNHPALAGHFPGNPVVPGVVILDEVVSLARQEHPELQLESLASVKFLTPLLPDEEAVISLESSGETLQFQVSRAGTMLARGKLRLGPPRDMP